MSDEYLWDRSGPRDPEVERLERLLGRLQSATPEPDWLHERAPRMHVGAPLLALAAALILACGAALWMARRPVEPAWSVTRVDGTPVIGARRLTGAGQLAVGELLTTDDRSRASVAVADVGRLDIAPDTQIRLVGTRGGRHRVALDRGTVHATIWAPPGEVVVDTPASTAVDLGCAYTLSVAPDGAGVIEVEVGWVGFEFNGREAFIPAGARCATRPRVGPGTPYLPRARSAGARRARRDRLRRAGRDGAARGDRRRHLGGTARGRDDCVAPPGTSARRRPGPGLRSTRPARAAPRRRHA